MMSLAFGILLLGCLGLVGYVYLGYPAAVWLLARLCGRPVRRAPVYPPLSVVIAARDEAATIGAKIENCLGLAYPGAGTEVVVVSDGSADGTLEMARRYAGPRVQVLGLEEPGGKAVALNRGVAAARGELILFTDARQRLAPDAALRLAENFADPGVGAASGELILGEADGRRAGEPVGVYWRYEKLIRRSESAFNSTVGATGAIYAIRRCLYHPLPAGTVLDDVVTPLRIVLQGYRVVWDGSARAYDAAPGALRREFQRKVRTLAGNFQTLVLVPGLLNPRRNPLFWQLVSHKLGRLAVPYALLGALLASGLGTGRLFQLLFWGQVAGYAAALLGPALPVIGGAAQTFLAINCAAVVGCYYFLRGQHIPWRPAVPAGADEAAGWGSGGAGSGGTDAAWLRRGNRA